MKQHTSSGDFLSPQLKYRPDIDGLRAIAVLGVVLFHAFPGGVRGGFVGVDIFFVISGYLITTILLKDLMAGRYSLWMFYVRRIKRIFPALIVVLASCMAFGWFALYPYELSALGKHVAAGAGFLSNFFLWQESGYFDKAGEIKPLLHLWSLGVEEQYYIFWPLLLFIAWRRHLRFLVCIFALGIASFILSIYLVRVDPSQAFYAPWSRFWELLAGSGLAFVHQQKGHPWTLRICDRGLVILRVLKLSVLTKPDCQSLLGGTLILIGMLLISKGMLFPGGWALLPTLGACLVISAGPEGWMNRVFLSHPVMVGIGLISYPLYLWHWPLLSFANIMASGMPPMSIRLIAVLIAFALALATYRWVERPIRTRPTRKIVISGLVFAMLSLGLTGLAMNQRIANSAPTKPVSGSSVLPAYSRCPFEGEAKSYCLVLDPTRPADTVLIGDSHAGHLAAGLLEIYNSAHRNIAIQWGGDCLPFFQDPGHKTFSSVCDQTLINRALDLAIESPSIKTVILSSYAIAKIQQRAESMNRSYGYVNNPSSLEIHKNGLRFKEAMFETIERLQKNGKRVIYIVDVPELYFDPQACFARPLELPGHRVESPCAVDLQAFEARNSVYHEIVNAARLRFPKAKFIEAYKYLCDENLCYALINNQLLYKDRDHLNPAGSRYLVGKIADSVLEE